MRKWWVWVAALLPAAALFAAPPPAPTASSPVQVTPELTAALTPQYELVVTVTPHRGDAWSRLARRITGDGNRWNEIAEFNHAGPSLTSEMAVRVPFLLIRPDLQRQIVTSLFPNDRVAAAGWRHVVVGNGVEGESLWNIAEWFTGDGAHYAAIRKANPDQGLSTHEGDVIVIPKELLTAAFRAAGDKEGENAASATAEIRHPASDPVQRPAANEDAAEAAVVEAVPTGQPSLTFGRDESGAWAAYRLQKGEALYSSVAIRFTGRVYSKDVGDVVARLVEFNGIQDVARIRAGKEIRIPMDLLLPEYRPASDPTRLADEAARRASSQRAKRSSAKNLSGVTVILDAGHGGRDLGTIYGNVSESRYVYDVVCRLKRILEQRSGARVAVTTKSKSSGYDIDEDDELVAQKDHVVLTTPRYPLDDSVVGVNLRWYLANSIFARAIRKGVAREKVVFLSIHADSLHPSLRGAMLYIPGERYVQGSFRKRDQVYLARAEVRERPVVQHSEDESLEAEGLSRDLAESIVDELDARDLKVHPFNPVRDNVVRDGREWVPAVIRYNMVPTRALIEICNVANPRDRELMTTRKWRETMAEAIYRGIVAFYADRDALPAEKVAATGR